MKIKLSALLILIPILACSGLQRMPEEGTPELELVKQKCTVCHGLPHPRRHTASEWDHYLGLMKTHMESKNILITDEEFQTIRAYLHRNAR